jgi:hypothetical protein
MSRLADFEKRESESMFYLPYKSGRHEDCGDSRLTNQRSAVSKTQKRGYFCIWL